MKKLLLSSALLFLTIAFSQNLFAQTLYWGGTGDWNGSTGWSTTSSGPFTTAWSASTTTVYFNIAGTINNPGTGTAFSSVATFNCNENMTVTGAGNTSFRIGNNGGLSTFNIAPGKTFNIGTQYLMANASSYALSGLGTFIGGGTGYTGGFTLDGGTVVATGSTAPFSYNVFGAGALTITSNGATIAASVNTNFASTSMSLGGNLTFGLGSNISSSDASANLTFLQGCPISLGSATRTITVNTVSDGSTTGLVNLRGPISCTASSGAGITLASGSTGVLVLGNFNYTSTSTYEGPTTINGGTLALGHNEMIPNGSSMVFNGGTFKTSASGTGYTETVGTLQLLDNSTLTFGTGSHTLTFAASNGVSWTSGKTLTITNWQGGYNGTSGTAGKIFVTNAATSPSIIPGLTGAQLAQIRFFSSGQYYEATVLSTGEVVPTATVLPISLASFTGSSTLSGNQLNWSTASEQNNSHFEVLRAGEDKVFSKIGQVDGNGNKNSISTYSFLDKSPLKGTNYYKLNQVDFDGKSIMYGPVSVKNKFESAPTLSVYGTAANLNVSFENDHTELGSLKCFDLNGKLILNKSVSLQKGNNTFKISELSNASSGIYIFIMETSNGAQKIKYSF
ncbi:T9SS type A sorting domain-containing protein [Pelobium sp.]|nr:T9SS type A sorting domain-containing protein [Pelobium sp.]MDA9555527.1 T9SS type A sorting domain-containing protein [Pelobium sp.]